jgi:alpha,alpha-trehalose phosphorylase
LLRRRLTPPPDLFAVDPWAIDTHHYSGRFLHEAETIFALANGLLGIRGTHEEGYPLGEPGTYVNAFHETRPIVYAEDAYGLPRTSQTMVNCPEGAILKLHVDDEPLDVAGCHLTSYRRRLDMRRATLERELVWATPSGRRVRLRTVRLVSLSHRHLAAILYEVTVLDGCSDIVIVSELVNREPLKIRETMDPRLAPGFVERVLEPAGHTLDGPRAVLAFRTRRSGMALACGMDHVLSGAADPTLTMTGEGNRAELVLKYRACAGRTVRLVKYLAYHASGHHPATELRAQVGWTLDRAGTAGIERVQEEQRAAAADFWARSDVRIGDRADRQQVVRWNLFQLLQASACVDGAGIGARGLTGRSYEGHYFWDTEIYVLPFLIYTNPRVARSLLLFRYDKLDKARRRAAELGHRGALFPWRTINGEEASAYFAASTAQYHINADIAFAIRKYVEVTGDLTFLHDYGAEILVETARLWADLGYFNPRLGGAFCITGVTGPDEYTALVNNNYFTNLMAQENLRYAASTLRSIRQDQPRCWAKLVRMCGLEEQEPDRWARAADAMFLPYDEVLGVNPQDDSFLDKEVWDFAGTPPENYPLLLHYHPLNLYRRQVIKQADTLLAMFLLGHNIPTEQKKRNFDYYDPLTTHDSSLSVCIQSIVANEIGYSHKALEYFNFAATMDLSDISGNVQHGAHIASIGGSWLALVYGFGGLRDAGGRIHFRPRLPGEWTELCFQLLIRGSQLCVVVRPDGTSYRLADGPALTFRHEEREIELTPDRPEIVISALDAQGSASTPREAAE